jgi:hypothetical protein
MTKNIAQLTCDVYNEAGTDVTFTVENLRIDKYSRLFKSLKLGRERRTDSQ